MTKEETWEKLVELNVAKGKMSEGPWDLSMANLFRANLSKLDLSGANLTGADLSESDLSEANLSGANLLWAILSKANLTGALLSKANLTGTNLAEANLFRADLSKANLPGTYLTGTNLTGANLTGAYLSRALLSKALLTKADLTKANLSRAFLSGANFSQAKLIGTDLTHSIMSDVNFNLSNLSGADITGSTFWAVSTAGWKINDIEAQYVYFCQAGETDKEKYRRDFRKGQFEALHKALPTVELILGTGLNSKDLLILNAIIEDIRGQNPAFGIRIAEISTKGYQSRARIETTKDESLEEVGGLIQKAFEYAFKKGISLKMLTQTINRMLPSPYEAKIQPTKLQQQSPPIKIEQEFNVAVNYTKADGSKIEALVTQAGKTGSSLGFVIDNYETHREEADRLFESFKKSFREYKETMKNALTENTDRMIEAIWKGEEVSTIQGYWEQIKEDMKTGGAATIASTIAPHLARLLGLPM